MQIAILILLVAQLTSNALALPVFFGVARNPKPSATPSPPPALVKLSENPRQNHTEPAAPPMPSSSSSSSSSQQDDASIASAACNLMTAQLERPLSTGVCSDSAHIFSLPRNHLGLPPPSTVPPTTFDDQVRGLCNAPATRSCIAMQRSVLKTNPQSSSSSSSSCPATNEIKHRLAVTDLFCTFADGGCLHDFLTFAPRFPTKLSGADREKWCKSKCIQSAVASYVHNVASANILGVGIPKSQDLQKWNVGLCGDAHATTASAVPTNLVESRRSRRIN